MSKNSLWVGETICGFSIPGAGCVIWGGDLPLWGTVTCEEVALPGGLRLGVLSREPVCVGIVNLVDLDKEGAAIGDFTLVAAPMGGVGDVVSGLPTTISCVKSFPEVRPIDLDNGEFRPILLLGRL